MIVKFDRETSILGLAVGQKRCRGYWIGMNAWPPKNDNDDDGGDDDDKVNDNDNDARTTKRRMNMRTK